MKIAIRFPFFRLKIELILTFLHRCVFISFAYYSYAIAPAKTYDVPFCCCCCCCYTSLETHTANSRYVYAIHFYASERISVSMLWLVEFGSRHCQCTHFFQILMQIYRFMRNRMQSVVSHSFQLTCMCVCVSKCVCLCNMYQCLT